MFGKFPIEIERKTDILALTSFILSSIALSYQLSGYLADAKVKFFLPQTVTLAFDDPQSEGKSPSSLYLEARMSFTNMGEMGYNAILTDETVTFRGPSGMIELTWNNIYDNTQADRKNPKARLYSGQKAAGPRVIPARDAITHETEFVPFNKICSDPKDKACHEGDNFLSRNKELLEFLRQQKLELHFSAKTAARKSQVHSALCYIKPSSWEIALLERFGWVSVNCFAVQGQQ